MKVTCKGDEARNLKKCVVDKAIKRYSDSLNRRGMDLGGRGEFYARRHLRERVEVGCESVLKFTVKELDKLMDRI